MNRKGMLGNIIGGFVIILIGVSVLPHIVSTLGIRSNVSDISGASQTLLGLIPLFFSLAIMLVAISIVFNHLRSSGLVHSSLSSDDGEKDDEEGDEYDDVGEELEELKKKEVPLPKSKITEEEIIRSKFD